ncbi:MAG: hypothetical protein C0418_01410 [Coriobacteriaceae bacterium]|nr:hypothetical protein [Coriobacteriaceae bacterium]
MYERAVRLSEELYETLLNAADDVVFLLDRDQRYIGIWGRWIEGSGRTASDFIGKTPADIFGEGTRGFLEGTAARVLAGETVTCEGWFDVPWDGRIYYQTVLSPIRDASAQIIGLVGVSRDITELKAARDGLEHMALHDSLTELPNRAAFKHAVERATAKAERGTSSALMFLDIDNFKSCNDIGGHTLGDKVLAEIGGALRDNVREPDIVARIGGDEFGVLLEAVTPALAMERAESLAETVHALGLTYDLDIDLSVGIVAVVPGLGFDAALATADRAMYRAKESEIRVFLAS